MTAFRTIRIGDGKLSAVIIVVRTCSRPSTRWGGEVLREPLSWPLYRGRSGIARHSAPGRVLVFSETDLREPPAPNSIEDAVSIVGGARVAMRLIGGLSSQCPRPG